LLSVAPSLMYATTSLMTLSSMMFVAMPGSCR
jgi:hypothetical protein